MRGSTQTVVGFACAPSTTASDGGGRNSPYSKHLLKHMPTPSLDVGLMLRRVARGVREEASQVPYVNHSLIYEDNYLIA
jgi:uncharacterized caspase-like protein